MAGILSGVTGGRVKRASGSSPGTSSGCREARANALLCSARQRATRGWAVTDRLDEVVLPRDALRDAAQQYATDGFLSPIRILARDEAGDHRARMEAVEAGFGALHYKNKIHTILQSPYELATHPRALDIVEALIGRDILVYNVLYIVKEVASPAHVSWHQDLTYWGFDGDALVSMWLALSPTTPESGCMRMMVGSHLRGRLDHRPTDDATNILTQGQTVSDVAEENAVTCVLQPGQASFHHGWTLHSSRPNTGPDRRIGLSVAYLARLSLLVGRGFPVFGESGGAGAHLVPRQVHQAAPPALRRAPDSLPLAGSG